MSKKKKLWIDYIPAALAAVLIIFFAILRDQSIIKTLPTLITLAVQILLARTSRFAFLLGGANSVLYAISYYSEPLYFSAFFALFISMPIQIYSYFNWKKNSNGDDPNIRSLPFHLKITAVIGIIIAWIAFWKLLGNRMPSYQYPAIDSLIFTIGIMTTVLSAIRYVDAQYFCLVSSTLSLVLWTMIVMKSPENINYVIIALYNLFRGVEITIAWSKQSHKNEKNLRIINKINLSTTKKGKNNEKKCFY